jgi:hypothetical protein
MWPHSLTNNQPNIYLGNTTPYRWPFKEGNINIHTLQGPVVE